MLDPIILTEVIIRLAETWVDACLSRLSTLGQNSTESIGFEVVESPVNHERSKVRLYLSKKPMNASGMVFLPNTKFCREKPDYSEDNYVVIIDANRDYFCGIYRQKLMLAAILHEFTHVVDPEFEKDCQQKRIEPEKCDDHNWLCGLPSERRAFTAMWMAELRDWIRGQMDFTELDFAYSMTTYSPEFKGFFGSRSVSKDEVHAHFKAMMDQLRGAAPKASNSHPQASDT